MGLFVFLTILVVLQGPYLAHGECPHFDMTLQRWSMWSEKPLDAGSIVIISESILLDESPPDLYSIIITSTGRLVWSPDVVINLRVNYIWVEGRLDIGSEDCPYEGETTITLTGNRGDYELAAGPKVLLVASGGTLELHGRKKLSWTKLSKTIPKIHNSQELLYDHMKDDRGSLETDTFGLVAYSITPAANGTFTIKHFDVYNLHHRKNENHIKDTKKLTAQIEDLDDGDVFMMASQRYSPQYDRYTATEAYDAFEKLVFGEVTNTSLLRGVDRPDTYATIFQKGYPDSFQEIKGVLKDSIVYLDAEGGSELSFKVHCYSSRWDYRQYENFQIMTRLGRYPILDVIDDVTTWRPGDKIILTSTDYDWEQAEEKQVIECLECSNKQVRVDSIMNFMHWGEMIEDRVDERGEVALLTRNIVIRGEMMPECPDANENCGDYDYDTFGGHVKVLNGFADVHIEGVELYDVGQQTDLGRYPIHFHMCLDTSHSEPYIKDNSIHNTFARCVTIHGTHGVKIEDNVCYKSLGHSYFLEDGSEMNNTFDGNIAIGTLRGSLIPTDSSHPTSFWITNPLTYVRNNVAAGGDHTGFWYIYPIEPMGPSTALKLLEPWEASRTKLLDCDNNVAHSYEMLGFIMEEHLDADGNMKQTNYYQPREDPRDPESALLQINIDRLTSYKNRKRNVWLEGGHIRLHQCSSADAITGVSIFNTRNRDKDGSMTKSVIVGQSANIGEPGSWNGVDYPMSFPYIRHPYYPRRGFAYYKGPQLVEDVYFAGFEKNDYYKSGALSWQLNNVYFTSIYSWVKNALFAFNDSVEAGNRVFQGVEGEDPYYTNKDGDKSASFLDLDNNNLVMKPDPFTAMEGCVLRPNWKMATCPRIYGKVRVQITKDKTRPATSAIMVRDDMPSAGMEFTFDGFSGYPVALGGTHSYTLAFTTYTPEVIVVMSDGLEKDAWVRVGLCIPRDAEFTFYQYGGEYNVYTTWNKVSSLEELDKVDAKTGTKLFHDTDKGVLYFVMFNNLTRAANETKDCPKGLCPVFRFTLKNGTVTDSDCRPRVFTDKQYKIKPKTLPENTDVIPANAVKAPDGWGAGPTRPFLNRLPVDGGYSDWTDWTSCSKTCGGGIQTRERFCNNPPTANGGLDCEGPRTESLDCAPEPCPVDGGFSSWSEWTSCVELSNCSGSRTRSRDCSEPEPQHGGKSCSGYTEEVEACTAC